MEVDDAIKNIKMFHFKNLPRFKPELIELLKSLEAENKKLKKENKALRKDKWELEGINEACRKENEAYREMWEESKKRFFSCEIVEVAEIINKLEQEYLGGGE